MNYTYKHTYNLKNSSNPFFLQLLQSIPIIALCLFFLLSHTTITAQDTNTNKIIFATPYIESRDGDLSDNGTGPTVIVPILGDNMISACVQGSPLDVDYFTFEVPANMVLSAIELTAYTSANAAFLGIQKGAIFTESRTIRDPSNLLGGITYNASHIGTDLLPQIGSLFGAIGFTGPLPAGKYTIWLNETSTALSCPTLNLVIMAANNCPATLMYDNQVLSAGTFTASNSITTMNMVSVASGATVVLEAGQMITLEPGFTAIPSNGGSFTARIANCAASPIAPPEVESFSRNKASIPSKPIEELNARIYPNPTRQAATLSYTLPTKQELTINLFNSNGLLVQQLLAKQTKDAGQHQLSFISNQLPTGIYLLHIQTAKEQVYRKINIIGQY